MKSTATMRRTGYTCQRRFHGKDARTLRALSTLRLVLAWVFFLACAQHISAQANVQEIVPFRQSGLSEQASDELEVVVEGTVFNHLTHEPIPRALVYTLGNRYATFTDDQGHFALKFPKPDNTPQRVGSPSDLESFSPVRARFETHTQPTGLVARKPGYLVGFNRTALPDGQDAHAQMALELEPEALIVGHVKFPGEESSERITLQLYRKELEEGREHWSQVSFINTWTTGEFRFYDLKAGTYKLLTTERLERDPATFNPQDQLYGYPPVFYPNANDLASADPIHLKEGARVEVNLNMVRRVYYPVKIAVANPPADGALRIHVYPRNHPGPGYALGYDSAEQTVEGALPDGDYTLRIGTFSEAGMSGVKNFSVHGGPLEGAGVALVPNLAVTAVISKELDTLGTTPQQTPENDRRRALVDVSLSHEEQFDDVKEPSKAARPVDRDDTLTFKNVTPGRYWLNAFAVNCYVASASWGGTDALRQPMELSADSAELPIQIVLRNDGATVSGKIASSQPGAPTAAEMSWKSSGDAYVYFIPLDETAGEFRMTPGQRDLEFQVKQIPPGTYRIVALDQLDGEIGRANPVVRRKYEGKGVVVELVPNQTLELPTPLTVMDLP